MKNETDRTTTSSSTSLAALRRYAQWMDSKWTIPGTRIRIGVDALVGLIPGVGDLAGMGLSFWVLEVARRHDVPNHVLLRMLGNVGLETLVGVIPIVGDAFDVVFRANQRNVRLLERALAKRGQLEEPAGVPAGDGDGSRWVQAEVLEPAPRPAPDATREQHAPGVADVPPYGPASQGPRTQGPPEPSWRSW